MTFRTAYSYLGKAGVILLVAIASFSLFQRVGLQGFVLPAGYQATEIGAEITRAQCLLGALPQDINTFGYLPYLPMRMEDPHITNSILRLRGKEYQVLYLTQYALAPKIISFYESEPWVIANYPDHSTGIEAIDQAEYTILKDCGNGVFLLHR